MDEEACCKSGCGNTSGVLVAFRAKSDEWDLLSAFLHVVFACNGNLTCLSGLFFLGADGCTVIENHHEPPQNESWFLVWILSKVPRYSILCYIMLYSILTWDADPSVTKNNTWMYHVNKEKGMGCVDLCGVSVGLPLLRPLGAVLTRRWPQFGQIWKFDCCGLTWQVALSWISSM